MYKASETTWFEEEESYIKSLKPHSNKYVKAICPLCGKVRSGILNNFTKSSNTICKDCKQRSRSNKYIGQTMNGVLILSIIGFNKKRANVLCRCGCGKEFSATMNNIQTGEVRSCGCLVPTLVGEKHHSYKHSKTEEERALERKKRQNSGYRGWSRKVKEAFGYTCFICGKEKKLISHHIESFTNNPELRFDVYNGACLCDNCHKDYHVNFMGGTQNPATKESFVAFMEYKICQRLQA